MRDCLQPEGISHTPVFAMPSSSTFELAGRQFPKVTWYKDPGMRKTYICLMLVVLTAVCIFDNSRHGHH